MGKKLYLSNSSAQVFLDCKKRFKLQYVDRVKVDQETANKYLSFGNSMHAALAAYNHLSSQEYRTLSNLHNLLRSNWIREGYESMEEERSFGLKGLDMLTKYFNDPLDSGPRNLLIEGFIKKDLSPNCILCGKLDKIYVAKDEQVEIVDYKTGDNITPVNLIQLYIYVLLNKEHLGSYPQLVSLYFLAHNKKITHVVDDSFIHEAMQMIEWLHASMTNEVTYKANPTVNCKSNCPYFNNCVEARDTNQIVINAILNNDENIDKTVFF